MKRAFPSYSSLQKKKPKESNEEHASKLKSAALAYGHKNADKSKMKELRSFLSDKLRSFHASNAAKSDDEKPKDDDGDDDPEVLPAPNAKDGSDKQSKAAKRDPPGDGDDGEWVKLPSSDFENHFYFQNTKTGATQCEDPAASKKKKPPGPPPGWGAPPSSFSTYSKDRPPNNRLFLFAKYIGGLPVSSLLCKILQRLMFSQSLM